jgi:hypothetical protein
MGKRFVCFDSATEVLLGIWQAAYRDDDEFFFDSEPVLFDKRLVRIRLVR